ncbi:MAG: hypothetical protein RMK18_05185 [Armatimonadota bacterium]|nr:hypothetical protein [Armatimonadota bacterium]MCX7776612.1 hypothetical protein [Armatimonadota bacterium]MDW8025245.1 hypothetical protein [Armatimonadota bacterium]
MSESQTTAPALFLKVRIAMFMLMFLLCWFSASLEAHAGDGNEQTATADVGGGQTEDRISDGEIKLSRMNQVDSQPSRMIKAQPMPKVEDEQLNSWRIALPPQLEDAPSEPKLMIKPESKSQPQSSGRRKLQVRGTALLSYNIHNVKTFSSAGRTAFVQENYGIAKSLHYYSSVAVEGPILGKLRVRAQFNAPSYSPRSNTFILEYPMGNFLFRYGDMSLSIAGNRFASLTRWIRGFELRYSLDGKAESVYSIGGSSATGNELVIVTAEGKSQIKRDAIQGNNTAGPFFLSSSPIIEGSEQVLVDMRQMKRGEDYQIDYDTGMLTFLGATVIPPTSTIIVTYEAAHPGEGIGRFWGARLNWRAGSRTRFGVSFMTQGAVQRHSSYDGVRRREEFLGSNTVGPFQLSQRPIIEGSELVSVNGILQERNRDYIINYISGLITFVRPVPVGAIIAVEYLQRISHGAAIGQHRVIGLDADISLGRFGEVSLQLARSSGPARSGTAIEVASKFTFGSLKAQVEQGGGASGANQLGERVNPIPQQAEVNRRSSEVEVDNLSGVSEWDDLGDADGKLRIADNPAASAGSELASEVQHYERDAIGDNPFESHATLRSRTRTTQPLNPIAERRRWGAMLGEPYGETRFGAVRTELSLRLLKVTPGFAKIENADFYQNESGFEASLIHRFTPHIVLTSHWVNANTSYIVGAFGGISSPTGSKRLSVALSFDKPNLPSLRLAHQRFSFGSKSNSNEYASTSALLSYRHKRWSIDAAYESNLQSYLSGAAGAQSSTYGTSSSPIYGASQLSDGKMALQGGSTSNARRTRTTLCRLSLKFEPSERLFLSADWSSNRSASGSQSSNASNLLLGASFQPSRSLRLSLSHNILIGSSSAGIGSFIIGGASGAYSGLPYTFGAYDIGGAHYGGTLTGLGGYGTFGAAQRPITGLGGISAIGYYGGMTSEPFNYGGEWRTRQTDGGSGSTIASARNKSVVTVASLDWQPSSRLSLLCQWSRQLAHGSSFIADYGGTDYSLQFGYQLSQRLMLTGQFCRQKQSFLQPSSDSFTTIYGVGMQYAGSRLNTSLYWNVLSSESTQQVSPEEPGQLNNTFASITLDATYRLSRRLELMGTLVHAKNRGIGGYAQNSFRIAIGYRIFEQLWLDINMERIDRKDLLNTGGDYKATVVSFQLRGTF